MQLFEFWAVSAAYFVYCAINELTQWCTFSNFLESITMVEIRSFEKKSLKILTTNKLYDIVDRIVKSCIILTH